MTPLEVVVLQEAVKVTLNLGRFEIPGGAAGDTEALVEQRAVHALDEAVGPGRANLGRPMLDTVHGQEQFEGVLLGAPAVLSTIVGKDRPDGDAQRLVEGQDALVEEVTGSNGHLRRVDLREGEGAEDVDDDLDVDLPDALERAPVERVLVEQLAGLGGFDVPAAEVDAVAFQQTDLFLGQ